MAPKDRNLDQGKFRKTFTHAQQSINFQSTLFFEGGT